MQKNSYNRILFSFILICLFGLHGFAQLGVSFDVKKPKQYEDRVLRSEKTNKKLTVPRRFIQNTTTHYNYFFNANNKINEILEKAKEANKDDYSDLLPFYNYTLDRTAADSIQLDSVVYKASSGIVLHDLRSDWADNMYLLWGTSYFLQKKFDSAFMTFQFINYAFAPKEKDGYYKYIGSKMDGNNALSIVTKEKSSLTQKLFTTPPSRNDAFIWQIRTFLAMDAMPEAASLIVTLKNDPLFPKRLQNDLEEVQAFYFYKQNMWDSSATHLIEALGNATNKQEQARWEYLAGQMFEMAHKYDLAQKYFDKAIGHTTDPIMEVYARLNSIRNDRQENTNDLLAKNIAALVKMAKKDRFTEYRDVIYYMAAQMELERNNIAGAQELLLKAAKYDSGNPTQKNRIYLKLAELAFNARNYLPAHDYYDSLNLSDPYLKDTATILFRKDALSRIALNSAVITRQDSMLKLVAMEEEERKDFVRKLAKKLRKEQGYKDEDNKLTTGSLVDIPDLFTAPQQAAGKSDWYFYNTQLKSKGLADFKKKWGNRPNADNWRRGSLLAAQFNISVNPRTDPSAPGKRNTNSNAPDQEITFESLYANIPLTSDKVKIVADSIVASLLSLGKIYSDELEDCQSSIETYELLRSRYPGYNKMDEVLFHLYYCYNKTGNTGRAAEMKQLLEKNYMNSRYTSILTTGKDSVTAATKMKGSGEYEKIYDLFIEGNFDEAIALKKKADSTYGENYWSPQLLYIESVYLIKQRRDSLAIVSLQKLVAKYPTSPLADKSTTLINVVKRRAEIEEELKNLKVEEQQTTQPQNPVLVRNDATIDSAKWKASIAKADSLRNAIKKQDTKPATTQPVVKTDSLVKKQVVTPYSFVSNSPHYVAVILNKVDIVYGNEAKNAFFRYNREQYSNKTYELQTQDLDADNKILLIKPFENADAAVAYAKKAKAEAATQIVPWLKADKYSFIIVGENNLQTLLQTKDLSLYRKFLEQNLPGIF